MFRIWGVTKDATESGNYNVNFHKVDLSNGPMAKYFITVSFGHHGEEVVEFDHTELDQFTDFLKEINKLKRHIGDPHDLYNKLFTVDGEMSRSCLDFAPSHQSVPYIRDLCAYKLQDGEYYKVVLSE